MLFGPMRASLGYGRRLAVLLMAFNLAFGASLHLVQATNMMVEMAVSAHATPDSDCDGCPNPQMDSAGCTPATCAPSCGNSTCAILSSGGMVRPTLEMAVPEPALASFLTWLTSPDPPPPRLA
jgi:hypothetical protein